MKRLRVDAFLVPRADEHQGEYVPPSAERLQVADRLFRLGRHGRGRGDQGGRCSSTAATRCRRASRCRHPSSTIVQVPQAKLADWLIGTLRPGAVVGFDPWLHTLAEIERLTIGARSQGHPPEAGVAQSGRCAWGDERPAPPQGRVAIQPMALAGTPAEDKIAACRRN